jgi:hypothetical protein
VTERWNFSDAVKILERTRLGRFEFHDGGHAHLPEGTREIHTSLPQLMLHCNYNSQFGSRL